MQSATRLAAAALVLRLAVAALPSVDDRVDFSQHGGDWTQGQCASRAFQSPIDLNALFKIPDYGFTYFYNDVHSQNVTLSNDGRSIYIDVTGEGFGGISLPTSDRHFFNLKRIEFHALSEHTFRGEHLPVEMQLIHQASNMQDPTIGNELVTISVLFDCDTRPSPKVTWPGFLQEAAAGIKKESFARPPRRGRQPQSFTPKQAGFLQQPIAVENVIQAAGGPIEVLDKEGDPNVDPVASEAADTEQLEPERFEADHEVDYARTMLMGESRLEAQGEAPAAAVAAAPGPAPGPDPLAFVVPTPDEANFNVMFQLFAQQEPPGLDDEVHVKIDASLPLQLGRFMKDGTFFQYRGSETAPPCAEKVMWLVRREKVLASDLQMKAFVDALYRMSLDNGNYRTGMPLNNREITIVRGVEAEPLAKPLSSQKDFDDGRDSKYIPMAEDAITISKAATDYARDLDIRLKRSANADTEAVLSGLAPPPPNQPVPTLRPIVIPKAPMDTIWAAGQITKIVKAEINKAIARDFQEVVPAAQNLARSYLRQKLLTKVGFKAPYDPLTAMAAPTAVPGMAGGTTPMPTTTMAPLTPCPH